MVRNLRYQRRTHYSDFICVLLFSLSLLHTTVGEDTIDALDVVEEQTTHESTTDVEVDGDSSYKQSPMEEWDEVVLVEEDHAKTVFGSDDMPVDEWVREKMMEVKCIEDALLLKGSLREGWGDWFDMKSDFLRKDKMLKSNLEALNPLNNPMFQDPDTPGLTILTKADKLLQMSMLNEFKKIPFPLGRSSRNPSYHDLALGVLVRDY